MIFEGTVLRSVWRTWRLQSLNSKFNIKLIILTYFFKYRKNSRSLCFRRRKSANATHVCRHTKTDFTSIRLRLMFSALVAVPSDSPEKVKSSTKDNRFYRTGRSSDHRLGGILPTRSFVLGSSVSFVIQTVFAHIGRKTRLSHCSHSFIAQRG